MLKGFSFRVWRIKSWFSGDFGYLTLTNSESLSKRLISLDVFRGWTMLWIVGGTAILEGLQRLSPNPVLNVTIYELTHSEWRGLRLEDCSGHHSC
jgi:hypothetical protein